MLSVTLTIVLGSLPAVAISSIPHAPPGTSILPIQSEPDPQAQLAEIEAQIEALIAEAREEVANLAAAEESVAGGSLPFPLSASGAMARVLSELPAETLAEILIEGEKAQVPSARGDVEFLIEPLSRQAVAGGECVTARVTVLSHDDQAPSPQLIYCSTTPLLTINVELEP